MALRLISKPGCTYCDRAKDLLKEIGISFEEDLRDTPEAQDAFRQEGFQTYPAIFDSGYFIGGYTELEDYLAA